MRNLADFSQPYVAHLLSNIFQFEISVIGFHGFQDGFTSSLRCEHVRRNISDHMLLLKQSVFEHVWKGSVRILFFLNAYMYLI